MTKSARNECYNRINVSVREGFERYYQEFPERRNDARATDALAWALRGISRVYSILDDYEITPRDKAVADKEKH